MLALIVRVTGSAGLIGLLLAVAPFGCTSRQNPPHANPSAHAAGPVYPTMEEAAVGAWDFPDPNYCCEGNPAPEKGIADRAATIRLWKSRPELLNLKRVDLNGDGVEDVLLCNAHYVDRDGKERSAAAGVGQWCLWAALEKASGGWRVVGVGWGSCPPEALDNSTNGWKDLRDTYHLTAGSGIEYLYQFKGARYKRAKEADYNSRPDGHGQVKRGHSLLPDAKTQPIIHPSAAGWSLREAEDGSTIVVNPKGKEFRVGETAYPDRVPTTLWRVDVPRLGREFLVVFASPVASGVAPMTLFTIKENGDSIVRAADIPHHYEWDGDMTAEAVRDALFVDSDGDGVPELVDDDIWVKSGGKLTYYALVGDRFQPRWQDTYEIDEQTGSVVFAKRESVRK